MPSPELGRAPVALRQRLDRNYYALVIRAGVEKKMSTLFGLIETA